MTRYQVAVLVTFLLVMAGIMHITLIDWGWGYRRTAIWHWSQPLELEDEEASTRHALDGAKPPSPIRLAADLGSTNARECLVEFPWLDPMPKQTTPKPEYEDALAEVADFVRSGGLERVRLADPQETRRAVDACWLDAAAWLRESFPDQYEKWYVEARAKEKTQGDLRRKLDWLEVLSRRFNPREAVVFGVHASQSVGVLTSLLGGILLPLALVFVALFLMGGRRAATVERAA